MPTDIAVKQSPTGKLAFSFDASADVAMDDSEEHAVICQLLEHRAPSQAAGSAASEDRDVGWWADTDGTHGSELHTLRSLKTTTPSRAEALAQAALDDLANEGRIVDPRASARRAEVSGRLTVQATYTTTGAGPQRTTTTL
jgi:phage gp46-like protein